MSLTSLGQIGAGSNWASNRKEDAVDQEAETPPTPASPVTHQKGASADRNEASNAATSPSGTPGKPSQAKKGRAPAGKTTGSAPQKPSSDGAMALAEFESSETDSITGLTPGEIEVLYRMEDSEEPGCPRILDDWQPELPLIEEERPQRALLHKRRAQRHLMTGKENRARKELCKAAHLNPGGSGAEMLAGLYLGQRSLQNAEEIARELLQANPKSTSAKELLGDILNQKGDLTGARRAWLQVLDVDADESAVLKDVCSRWVKNALAALRARDVPRAERLLRRAVTFDPHNASAAYLMSQVLSRQGARKASLAWAKRAREID